MRAPMRVLPLYSYATQTRAATSHDAARPGGGTAIAPNLPVRELEARLGWQVDTLLLDCEGCIEYLLASRGADHLHQL